MTLDVVFVHQADRYVEEGNFRGIQYMNVVAPFLLNIVLYGIPAFVIIYVFGGAAPAALQAIPQWAINGLNMVGALMPALGIGILLNYLAKREFMPMFLIGYFLAVLLKLNLNALAVFGGLIAAFYYFMKTQPARQGA
jgi:D-glucosaminate-specific PTS system IIC component